MGPGGRFVVCGCGQVGYRVACLILSLDCELLLITDEIRHDWRRNLEEAGAKVVIGDATDRGILDSAGVRGSRALLALTSSDATNIRIALETKRLDRDIWVVARMFDQNLAQQLDEGIGIERALAMSVVAAPSFASAAVGSDVVGEFHRGDKRYLLVRTQVGEDSSLAGLSPREVRSKFKADTLYRVDATGRPRLDDHHDEPLAIGESMKLIGEPHDLVSLVPAVTTRSKKKLHRHLVSAMWDTVPKTFKVLLACVAFLVLGSVLFFKTVMGLSPIDSFYFVITTLTTTGYGDISVKDQGTWIKVYACILMGLGSAIIAVLYSIITDLIVTARFKELVGEKPIPAEGHVVVVGLGDVGYRVVEELQESGLQPVVIDVNSETQYAPAVRARVPFVKGDAREPETLLKANLKNARSLVVTTGNDAVNLSVGLLAKQVSPGVRTVLRIFDASFASAVQDVLGIDEALSASRLSAPEFVAAAVYPDTVAAFVLRRHLFVLAGAGEGGRPVEVGGGNIKVHSMELTRPEIFERA